MRELHHLRWGISTLAGALPCLALLAALAGCADDTSGPLSAAPDSSGPRASQAADHGEIWIAAQDRSEIHLLHGMGRIEVIRLPGGTGPHEIDFSPSGRFAYVANVDDGSMRVIRTADRTEVAMLPLGELGGAGDVGTHQARPSPDGQVILVAQIPARKLFKVLADEASETWKLVDELDFEPLGAGPVCTAFRADGQRAYVSVAPPTHGIAVVDVATMTFVTEVGDQGRLATEGNVQCGLVNSKNRRLIYVDSWGTGQTRGHFYVLDTATDELTEITSFPALDLHGFAMSPNERWAYAAERGGDALRKIDLHNPTAVPTSIPVDPRPGEADRPDKVATRGNMVYVPLRAEGSVYVVNGNQERTKQVIRLVPPSANALHGVAVLP
jgi:DNA-binding beta-propeller fold protein YncE